MEDIQLNDTQLSILNYFNDPSEIIKDNSSLLMNSIATPLQVLLKALPKLKECEDLEVNISSLEKDGLLQKHILNVQMTFDGATAPRITDKGKKILKKLINRKEGK